MPLFSVVITSYNRAAILQNAIRAVLSQTFTSFELIIVDNCSTDNTGEMLEQFKDRIRVFSTERNSGSPARPRNMGIRQAVGEWICLCDSDDEFEPSHLEQLHSVIEQENPGDAIISTNAWIMLHGKKTDRTYFDKGDKATPVSFLRNWKNNKAILSSLCIRNRSVIPFREESSYQGIEDYIFLLDNMLHGKQHIYVSSPGISYNLNSDDSQRSVYYYNSQRLHRYKMALWVQNRLWQKPAGIPLLVIAGWDYIKYRIKKAISKTPVDGC
jgi:glycosyltransferase involved in cell wall biosynthesis